MTKHKYSDLDKDSLAMHRAGRPGKVEVVATKPLTTQRDLALAYSPGVAAPCLEIADDPATAYDYTAKGNMVAVISNGTAVLGLGNLGGLASKPVMEGKAVLFKRFADVDSIDLELDTEDVDEFINSVRYLGPSFGGINLEDIKAPECFLIESRLRELMDIPIFHDDQHGTAIISAAGFLNALDLTGRDIKTTKLVVNGAGSAGIACIELLKAFGVQHDNILLCDTRGVVYQGREEGMNQWKSAHAASTEARTLEEAMESADSFFGLSVAGAVTKDMVKSMADNPIIFAMANPDPEITPEEAREVRKDAIFATGRSDYPNQVNNVLGFPYIFRGALDVRARTINDEMKIAAARALAELAREDVPDEVAAAYSGRRLRYGPDYIIPVPFDPRLISAIPPAVAQAAVDTGVAQKEMPEIEGYKRELSARLDPTVSMLQAIHEELKASPRRVGFAEGEEETTIRAAIAFSQAGHGTPVLIGREDQIKSTIKRLGMTGADSIEIHNAALSRGNRHYIEYLYQRLQREGYLYRDCQRLVHQDRNVFSACMLVHGDIDAMVTGLSRNYLVAYDNIRLAIDPVRGAEVFGLSMMTSRGRTVFIADTTINERPSAEQLARIARQCAEKARALGHDPRVAFLSYANFGNPPGALASQVRDAVSILDDEGADFEYDGEMSPDVALDMDLRVVYPFCRLTGPANILIMPGLHAAAISSQILHKLGGGTVIGPLLTGLTRAVQIAPINAKDADLVNFASLAAYDSLVIARAEKQKPETKKSRVAEARRKSDGAKTGKKTAKKK
ncbi:MAG: NADP-dependent malic enzyme [Rhodospirillaceae bacterium]|nr:NADP-dependent malic enzyme [Rhodospirillaceae bacterium]